MGSGPLSSTGRGKYQASYLNLWNCHQKLQTRNETELPFCFCQNVGRSLTHFWMGSYGMMAWWRRAESHVGQWGTFYLFRGHILCACLSLKQRLPHLLKFSLQGWWQPLSTLKSKARPAKAVHIHQHSLFMGHSAVVQQQQCLFCVIFMALCNSSISLLHCWLAWASVGKPRFPLATPMLGLYQASSCLQGALGTWRRGYELPLAGWAVLCFTTELG